MKPTAYNTIFNQSLGKHGPKEDFLTQIPEQSIFLVQVSLYPDSKSCAILNKLLAYLRIAQFDLEPLKVRLVQSNTSTMSAKQLRGLGEQIDTFPVGMYRFVLLPRVTQDIYSLALILNPRDEQLRRLYEIWADRTNLIQANQTYAPYILCVKDIKPYLDKKEYHRLGRRVTGLNTLLQSAPHNVVFDRIQIS